MANKNKERIEEIKDRLEGMFSGKALIKAEKTIAALGGVKQVNQLPADEKVLKAAEEMISSLEQKHSTFPQPKMDPNTPVSPVDIKPGYQAPPAASVNAPAADVINNLRLNNFKKSWAQTTDVAQKDVLRKAFGPRVFELNKVQRNKLGEMLLAEEGFSKAGLTTLPDMDDRLKSLKLLKEAIKDTSRSIKSIDTSIGIAHKGLLTSAGRIPSKILSFPEPKGPTKVEPTSADFDVDPRGKNVEVDRKQLIMDLDPQQSGGASPPTAAPTASAPAPAAVAVPTPNASDVREPTEFAKRVAADPAKYGTGSGRGKVVATKEQWAARKALTQELDPVTTAIKKEWAETLKTNKEKYGSGSSKNKTAAQKQASSNLYTEIETRVRGTAPARAVTPVKAAAPTPAPEPPAAVDLPGKKKKKKFKGGAPAPIPAPALPSPATPGVGIGDTLKKGAGFMRFLMPLLGIYGAYEVANMLKEGTIGEADERRLRTLEALGAVSGGMSQDLQNQEQIRTMQRMVDLAGVERQKNLDAMRQEYTGNMSLDTLLRGQQASLAMLAQPSRPSIAEMMARM